MFVTGTSGIASSTTMLPTQQILGESDGQRMNDLINMDFVFYAEHAELVHVLAVTFPVLCCRLYFFGWKQNPLDVVLAIVCSALGDQIVQWGNLAGCGGGTSLWLLGVHFVVCVLALLHYIQSHFLDIDSCLMLYISQDCNKGHNKVLMQALARCWVTMLALLTLLTVTGITYFMEMIDSDEPCWANSDSRASVTFVLSVLTISVLLVLIGVAALCYAYLVSASLSRGGAALNAIADKDFVERWGEPRPIMEEELRFSPQELTDLPCMDALSCNAEGLDCVICLSSILPGDRVRLLPDCGHAFHRPCVDQWLLRAGNCPLCKVKPTLLSRGASNEKA